jgi:pimeloyl-ACP methyl ester carboxylesterase
LRPRPLVVGIAEMTLRETRWSLFPPCEVPVLVANGDSDPMILPHYSYLIAGLVAQARLKIYPDSAHGFLFRHHDEFASDVEAFLS